MKKGNNYKLRMEGICFPALVCRSVHEASLLRVNPLVDPTRDRATRLRSSDAQKPKGTGIPDAKAFDVVPAQNIGERVTAIMCVQGRAEAR